MLNPLTFALFNKRGEGGREEREREVNLEREWERERRGRERESEGEKRGRTEREREGGGEVEREVESEREGGGGEGLADRAGADTRELSYIIVIRGTLLIRLSRGEGRVEWWMGWRLDFFAPSAVPEVYRCGCPWTGGGCSCLTRNLHSPKQISWVTTH